MALNHDVNEKEELLSPLPDAEQIDGSDVSEDELPASSNMQTGGTLASSLFDFFEMLILAACAILFLFTFVARISTVDGSSMNRTLADGDRLIVSDLFYTPKQGDIVVFQDLESGHDTAIVKRVIAVGGQTVRLRYTLVDGVNRVTVTVDGEPLDESAYRYYDESMYQFRYSDAEYTVPEGKLFVMGDNLHNSEDSRGVFGMVDVDTVLGRVVFRLMGDDFSDLFEKFGVVR